MRILVGLGTCGIAAGAEQTYRALASKLPGEAGQLDAREDRLRRDVLPGAAGRGARRQRGPLHLRRADRRQGRPADRRACHRRQADRRLARVGIGRPGLGDALPGAAESDRAAQLRHHRSGEDRAVHGAEGVRGAEEGPGREGPRGGDQPRHRVGPPRARRRRLPDRDEVALHAARPRQAEVRHRQRRRRGPGRLHGPLRPRERSPLGPRGDGDRGLRDRRAGRLHLRPRRVPEGDRAAQHRDRAGDRTRLPRRQHPGRPTSVST